MPIGTVNITLIDTKHNVGQLRIACDWSALMGDKEDELEEKSRVGAAVEAETGLRARFACYDYPTETAMFYI